MNLLILGANSDVAWATAKQFAAKTGADLILASRNLELLEKKARDLEARYNICARAIAFDAVAYDTHKAFYASLDPRPDGVVLAFGYMGDQQQAQNSFNACRKMIDVNFAGAVSILEIVAADFEQRNAGFIAGISSVAGNRGRQSNYMYGAAKAALTAYLSGLRNRLCKSNVHVITVLPGFIQTKMTEKMALPGLLTASPEQVAADIYAAYDKSRNIIYTRWFWRWIMTVIQLIPETLFKRLSL